MEQRYTALEWAALEGGQELPVDKIQLPFLQELVESRLYKGESTLQGKTAEDIAKAVFLSVMMLEILRHNQPSWARNYAQKTITYENFEVLRLTATDLSNMLTILNNQKKFENKIKTDYTISVPVLQLKRYLRDVANGNKDINADRQLFLKLEGFLKISDGTYRNIRRTVGDWRAAQSFDRRDASNNINTFINRLQNILPDIAVYFQTQ